MFRNYITIAVRNLAARKGYAIINLVGLTIGMCSCLLIWQRRSAWCSTSCLPGYCTHT